MSHKEKAGERTILYDFLSQKLTGDGLSREDLDEIKHHPIGHSSVIGFVELNLKVGNFAWRNGKLVNAHRRIGINITPQEELALSDMAKKDGLTVTELATKIVLETIGK